MEAYIKVVIISLIFLLQAALNDAEETCSPCKCFPPGTVETVDMDNMCLEMNGKCTCLKNVVGKECNKCKAGYWGIQSGKGCKRCNCSTMGSISKGRAPPKCNQFTGQCECKRGVTGLRCDRCTANWYDFKSKSGCKFCNCHTGGSENLQCNAKGKCICKPLAEGSKCNKCKENAKDIAKGCIPCSKCYNFVQEVANNFTGTLQNFSKLVDEAEPIDDDLSEKFNVGVKFLNGNITAFHANATEVIPIKRSKEIEKINKRLASVIKDADIIRKSVKKNNKSYKVIADRIHNNNKTIDTLNVALKTANKSVPVALQELENAFKINSETDGTHTEIIGKVEQGVKLANEIEEMLKNFQESVKKLNGSCMEACKSREEFLKILDDLKETKLQLESTEKDTRDMKKVAVNIKKDSERMRNESEKNSDALNDLDFSNFNIDLDEHIKAAKNILNKSEIIMVKDLPKFTKVIEDAKRNLEKAINTSEIAYLGLNKKKANLTKQTEIVKEYNTQLKAAEDLANSAILNLYNDLKILARNASNFTNNFAAFVKEINTKIGRIALEIEAYSKKLKDADKNVELLKIEINKMEDLMKKVRKHLNEYKIYLEYLIKLPLTNEELDPLENQIIKAEKRNAVYDKLIEDRDNLKLELDNLKIIEKSLIKTCYRQINFEVNKN